MDIAQCYTILHLSEKASAEDIRKAYITLAKTTHPDVTQQDDSEEFRQIVEAYEMLSNHIKKTQQSFRESDSNSTYQKKHTESTTSKSNIHTNTSEIPEKEDILVEPKRILPSFTLLHKLLQKWIDDEQCVYLKQEMCTPNKTIRFTIRYGIASTKKIIEFTLPEDIQYGQKIRLKGAGKKIGSLTGDLYLQICKPEPS